MDYMEGDPKTYTRKGEMEGGPKNSDMPKKEFQKDSSSGWLVGGLAG